MSHRLFSPCWLVFALLTSGLATAAVAAPPIAWHAAWDDGVFAEASQEHRFVLLDLHAVWCHWCHVMDQTTYVDAEVTRLIDKNYMAVSVDADSDPALTSRYGDWGWPATIVLAADGTEIVKRRGYIPPQQMASLLQAIIDDPSPGPSVQAGMALAPSPSTGLASSLRTVLLRTYNEQYDNDHGGWGRIHKFVDADSMELAFHRADSSRTSVKETGTCRARHTLNENLRLLDPVWGGVYQYSDTIDWRSPHFEKLMSYQADDLRLYAEAYARWRDPLYLKAATSLFGYITQFLSAPDGGFYASQDADVSAETTGQAYYRHDETDRRRLGMPTVDHHRYARETGWAIRALAKLYDVSGNQQALQSAQAGANWAIAHRARAEGGFRHDEDPSRVPSLDDNLAMVQAFLALYRSTADRTWLVHAEGTLGFIDATLHHADGGYISAPTATATRGVFSEPVRVPAQNAALARAANMAHRYTGNPRYRDMALHGMKYLAAIAAAEKGQPLPEILLADWELSTAPIHIAIVGNKHDPAAQALHTAALRYPADYLQIDWLDRTEGNLPNPDIQYPEMKIAAAFACADGACSNPVFDAGQIDSAVRRALRR